MLELTVMAHWSPFPSLPQLLPSLLKDERISALSRHSGLMVHMRTFRSKSMSPCFCKAYVFSGNRWQRIKHLHDKSGKPKSHGISIAQQRESNVSSIRWCDVSFDKVKKKPTETRKCCMVETQEMDKWSLVCLHDWVKGCAALEDVCLCTLGIVPKKINMQSVNWEEKVCENV